MHLGSAEGLSDISVIDEAIPRETASSSIPLGNDILLQVVNLQPPGKTSSVL